jgi:glucuronoarabinoxylan endo-1,4-beta-xylanase
LSLPRARAANSFDPGRRRVILAGSLSALLASVAGCTADRGDEAAETLRGRLTTSAELTLDTSIRYQRISGFGASSAWTGGSISEVWADAFFSPQRGIGLSLLRVHIAPDGTTVETRTAQRAIARGAAVWAAPWSPPGEWKTSGTETNGGSLLPDFYQDWADRLAGFAVSMKAQGVPLLALSAQNEPNWSADWETCVYTPDELVTFVGQYLGPALARDSPETQLIGPETIDWSTLQQFADPLLADPAASSALGIVAVHAYGGTPYAYTAPAAAGKELWETEVSYDGSTSFQAALETARQVQRHLTVGGVNAFHYWWLLSETSGGLMKDGLLLPQAYGLGHYSKFVRPGYVRVDVPDTPQAGVSSSAYYDPESHRTVLVLVNETTKDLSVSLRLEGVVPLYVSPWVTSADESLAAHAPFAFQNPFTYVFAEQSVTSLVLSDTLDPTPHGEGDGGAPGTVGEGGAAGANGGAAGAGEPTDGEAESGSESGGSASVAGSSNDGGSPRPTAIAKTKRGAYLACSASFAASTPWKSAAWLGSLLLALRRRRRELGS